MLSSLLSPSRSSWSTRGGDRPPFPTRLGQAKRHSRSASDFDSNADLHVEDNSQDEDDGPDNATRRNEAEEGADDGDDEAGEDENNGEGEDGAGDTTPLLPIFSAAHLDLLPVYNLTHAIRLLVISRCETTLTWDQLRSPQVSQFLLKPIQQEILASHFSSATEYALMANCLQFRKEISLNPGNSGTSRTQAMICELLAIKLLKEYSARELIDALAYDFDPFQGQLPPIQDPPGDTSRPSRETSRQKAHRAPRISCVEIAIRAQSKRFLAHPLVVQQLEAIWAGTIVFHSVADSLHRPARRGMLTRTKSYGTSNLSTDLSSVSQMADSPSKLQYPKQRNNETSIGVAYHRTVTLYNPREASLFKLSRLRVPRYRNLLSTCSFAVLLGLFLAVLLEQSLEITKLEVFFWFWSAGYMLDEIVGFNEQGFGLYLASFWNIFDLGILLILIVHLLLRIYSVIMPDTKKHTIAHLAYDILAADAVLLFPRLFSVLDHYRYFSQLLIAFRMMTSDLIAVFVLILISCSGFFVALTLGFGNDTDTPGTMAYAVLQIVIGFTPAAWDRWPGYNALGKTILILFLFICHFLVVTILITVLTNSFMAIVQNGNEEHQYVFAVNTISMVKSDALFSYVAPTNVIAWILTPSRYFLPFRQYVKLNRTVIKVTHFPILLFIFLYEKLVLSSSVYDGIELIEPRGRPTPKPKLLRAPSNATVRQERALEEVFSRTYEETIRGTLKSRSRRNTSHVVNNWMRNTDLGAITSPQEQDRALADEAENQQPSVRRSRRRSIIPRRFSRFSRSIASDPEEFMGNSELLSPKGRPYASNDITPSFTGDVTQQKDVRNDQDATLGKYGGEKKLDYFSTQDSERTEIPKLQTFTDIATRSEAVASPKETRQSDILESPSGVLPESRPYLHARNTSDTTMLYNPVSDSITKASFAEGQKKSLDIPSAAGLSSFASLGAVTPTAKPTSNTAGRRTPKRTVANVSRTRPIMPPKQPQAFQSAPNLAGLVMLKARHRDGRQTPLALERDIGSDIGDNKGLGGGYVAPIAASFGTQMAYATGGLRPYAGDSEGQEMFGRLMLARMNQLEEGFRELFHEMRDNLRRADSRSRSRDQRPRGTRHHLSRARRGLIEVNKEDREEHLQKNPLKSQEAIRQQSDSARHIADEWVDEDDDNVPLAKGSSI